MTESIPAEEEALLARVRQSLARRARPQTPGAGKTDADARSAPLGYDDRLVALRDEIGEARLEDVPSWSRRWSDSVRCHWRGSIQPAC